MKTEIAQLGKTFNQIGRVLGKSADTCVVDEAQDIRINPDWYLLYNGTSEDGRGVPKYAGRTSNPYEALSFYRTQIKKAGPYAIGQIKRFTDTGEDFNLNEDDLKQDCKRNDKNVGLIKAKEKRKKDKETRDQASKPANYGAFA